MHKNFVSNIPFPCFVLDQDYHILVISKGAKPIFSVDIADSFFDMIAPPYHQKVLSFLESSEDNSFIEIPLMDKWDHIYYQVFKTRDTSGNIHIFCHLISKEAAQLRVAMDKMEKKMSDFNMELLHRKKNIEEKVQEIRQAEIGAGYRENIGKLAAGIAHEIRNPLTTVKGFIQLLKPQLKELGKEQYANIALDELNRANEIIYEFLNAAKPASNQARDTTYNTLIREIILLFESESLLRNIELTSSLSNKDALPVLEPGRLKQVLVNMIKNSMEALDGFDTEKKKRIMVQSKIAGANFIIQISDNGSGMDQKTLSSLFSPFFSTKEHGTGIGLSVCLKIIEDAGGNITVESTPGNGTTFCIALPLAIS
ncbi:ATP-binding protein [Bacillus sp. EB01]|uniref:ATP-binding protein n=1 Tax=Bacillus sp. EB01 TaxID=1347086 RepID=UPI000694C87C|nr:ATP-binding protein [Bacillus sp. EB01]